MNLKLYFLLFETEDIAASMSDAIGKAVTEPIENIEKDVKALDARVKTYLTKGSSEPTKAKSTTGASLPTSPSTTSTQGIGVPKPLRAKENETKAAKDLATNLVKDPKFISSLADKISSKLSR